MAGASDPFGHQAPHPVVRQCNSTFRRPWALFGMLFSMVTSVHNAKKGEQETKVLPLKIFCQFVGNTSLGALQVCNDTPCKEILILAIDLAPIDAKFWLPKRNTVAKLHHW